MLTSDQLILQLVKGSDIVFKHEIVQLVPPRPIKFTPSEKTVMRQEIQKLTDNGVIEVVSHCPGEYISNVFLREKKDGHFRMILNLKKLNKAVEYKHFKMDTLKTAITLMKRNCWFGSIDLKDAYFSVPIAFEYRKYLRFEFDGRLYQFTCFPNGLCEAPRKFTKLLKVVFSFLRKQGHVNLAYLDDSLMQGDEYADCQNNINDTAVLLDKCGFTVHPDKSVLIPTQVIVFLGFVLNSLNMTVRLTPQKAEKLKNLCVEMLSRETVTIRDLAALIGQMVASEPGVPYAPRFYKQLEIEKDLALKKSRGNFDALMTISPVGKADIQWWIDTVVCSYKSVETPDPQILVRSDSSDYAWGGVCQQTSTGGLWSQEEARLHINYKELKAAYLTLQTFCKARKQTHIRLEMDNVTAVAYIQNMGGQKAALNDLTREIIDWAREREIFGLVQCICQAVKIL